MSRCSICGNDYAASFGVVAADGQRYTFDSLECAAQQLAPVCGHCGCRILGHGIEGASARYCCAHCAREGGEGEAVDNTSGP
jgi:hypothetical protein